MSESVNIDIVDLLKDLGESLGDTTKAKIVKEAIHEIVRLRKSWKFQRKEAEWNNKSRLHFMDMFQTGAEMFEETNVCCAWCQFACSCRDNHASEECFKLNHSKYYAEIEKRIKNDQ